MPQPIPGSGILAVYAGHGKQVFTPAGKLLSGNDLVDAACGRAGWLH